MHRLESEIIRLRPLEPSDINILYEWENNLSVWRVSNTLTPFSKHILREYIKNAHLDIYQTRQLRLMIDLKAGEKKHRSIGTIDLFNFEPFHLHAGVGILISEEKDRKKGYASEALRLLITYSFDILQLHQLYCNILEHNDSSFKLFKKHGFEIIGEKKEWIKSGDQWLSEYMLQLINK